MKTAKHTTRGRLGRLGMLAAALVLSGAEAASINLATVNGTRIGTAIVPDAAELNQPAKVYIAAKFGTQWFVRGTGLQDWRPFSGGQSPVSAELTLRPQTPVAITDLDLTSLAGLTISVGYSTANSPLTAPGHQRVVYTVPIASTGGPTPLGLQAPVPNGEGAASTFSTVGTINTANLFFKPLGNGRACASCHDQSSGWSITPDTLATRFSASNGLDPVFRINDGANSPNAAVGTVEQRFAAYSMLRTKGLIRVGLPIPAGAEFALVSVDDPYGYASAKELSLFRRPLPTTNLQFHTALMWDGRETATATGGNLCIKGSNPPNCFASLNTGLAHQSNDAVMGHAQFAAGLTAAEQQQVVDFERTLFTTQTLDNAAGSLTSNGARSGPIPLATANFYFGQNDFAAGDYRTGTPFDRQVMTLFTAWRNADQAAPGTTPPADAVAKASIARGEQLFNNKLFTIAGVRGFNDDIGRPRVQGSCASCHSTPNVGTHSVPRFMDTGVANAGRRTPDLPLYTFRNLGTGETIATSDPGRALITGKWADMGKMKVPSLRGLESRSPYFHDGSENDVARLVQFYNRRFNIGFTTNEVADLAAFLKAL